MLVKKHRAHKLADLQAAKEEKCKVLMQNIESFEKKLQRREQQFITCRKELTKH